MLWRVQLLLLCVLLCSAGTVYGQGEPPPPIVFVPERAEGGVYDRAPHWEYHYSNPEEPWRTVYDLAYDASVTCSQYRATHQLYVGTHYQSSPMFYGGYNGAKMESLCDILVQAEPGTPVRITCQVTGAPNPALESCGYLGANGGVTSAAGAYTVIYQGAPRAVGEVVGWGSFQQPGTNAYQEASCDWGNTSTWVVASGDTPYPEYSQRGYHRVTPDDRSWGPHGPIQLTTYIEIWGNGWGALMYGRASIVQTVRVEILRGAGPVAVIDGPTNPTVYETCIFDGAGSYDQDEFGDNPAIIDYEWTIADTEKGPVTKHGSTADYQWTRPGSYDVTLKVTDNEGMTATATRTVNVVGVASLALVRDPAQGGGPVYECSSPAAGFRCWVYYADGRPAEDVTTEASWGVAGTHSVAAGVLTTGAVAGPETATVTAQYRGATGSMAVQVLPVAVDLTRVIYPPGTRGKPVTAICGQNLGPFRVGYTVVGGPAAPVRVTAVQFWAVQQYWTPSGPLDVSYPFAGVEVSPGTWTGSWLVNGPPGGGYRMVCTLYYQGTGACTKTGSDSVFTGSGFPIPPISFNVIQNPGSVQ